jgi:hypothetical protein
MSIRKDKFMLQVKVPASSPSLLFMSMSMVNVYVHAACMLMSMMFVCFHTVCPYPCRTQDLRTDTVMAMIMFMVMIMVMKQGHGQKHRKMEANIEMNISFLDSLCFEVNILKPTEAN